LENIATANREEQVQISACRVSSGAIGIYYRACFQGNIHFPDDAGIGIGSCTLDRSSTICRGGVGITRSTVGYVGVGGTGYPGITGGGKRSGSGRNIPCGIYEPESINVNIGKC
jgi:hypothetical protein